MSDRIAIWRHRLRWSIRSWLESQRWYRRRVGGHWEWWCDRVGEKPRWIQVRACVKAHVYAESIETRHAVELTRKSGEIDYDQREREILAYCRNRLRKDGITTAVLALSARIVSDDGALAFPAVHVCERPMEHVEIQGVYR